MILAFFCRNSSKESKEYLNQWHDSLRLFPSESTSIIKTVEKVSIGFLSSSDKTPLLYEDKENVLFVARGRIDNRKDLLFTLNLSESSSYTDEELMKESFLYFGGKYSQNT